MRRSSTVTVRVIFRKKRAILVEEVRDNIPFRYIVDGSQISMDNKETVEIPRSELEKGIEYGIPWQDVIENYTVTSEKMASELRINGIWTGQDAIKNPGIVQSAVLSACRKIMSDIMQISKESVKKENYNG